MTSTTTTYRVSITTTGEPPTVSDIESALSHAYGWDVIARDAGAEADPFTVRVLSEDGEVLAETGHATEEDALRTFDVQVAANIDTEGPMQPGDDNTTVQAFDEHGRILRETCAAIETARR